MKIALSASLVALAGLTAVSAHAEPRAQAPARPNLEGYWRVNFSLALEAPPGVPQLIVAEKDAPAVAAKVSKALSDEATAGLDPELPMLVEQSDGLPIVRGQRRSRAVVLPANGKLPYTVAGRSETKADPPPSSTDNPEQRPNAERCLVGGGQPPLSSFALDSQIQIVRTRNEVVIFLEYGADLRVVRLTDRHAPRLLWTNLGDSIGHFEGETLVVETIGQPDADRMHIAPTLIVPGAATVIERFTPLSNRELLYQFTVVDPKVYAAPWLGEFSWFRTDKPMYEHACHEGNYSLSNILSAARHLEAEKAASAAAH